MLLKLADWMTEYQKLDGLVVDTAIHHSIIGEQIKYNLENQDIPLITSMDDFRDDCRIAIVGGGPSLKDNLDELRKYKYIMACGSVHDYLVENEIIPTWCAIVDPDEIMGEYIKNPKHETKYLISSQCHPKLFDKLKGYPCYLWNAGSGNPVYQTYFREGDYTIGGGCTIGTRAMIIAMCFGYFNQYLFGFDTCIEVEYDNYKHHAYKFQKPELESLGTIQDIKLGGPDGRTFKVASYMLGQIVDFQNILKYYANRLKVTVIGGGALAHILELGIEQAKLLEKGV